MDSLKNEKLNESDFKKEILLVNFFASWCVPCIAEHDFLFELKKVLEITDTLQLSQSGLLKNKTFMFTGKLQNISRAEAKSLVEKNSGNIVSSVTKKLDYLVIGEKPTNRKVDQAKNLGVKIISQKEWADLLN